MALVRRVLLAHKIRRRVTVVVVASPVYSRGCAVVGGDRLVLSIAGPSRLEKPDGWRRLTRVLDHEAEHLAGREHRDMPARMRYSLGPASRWADGVRLRYEGRAPSQIP